MIKLQNTIKKLHNTASSVAFIKKALFVYIIPVYLQKSSKSSQNILKSHLTKHIQDLYSFSIRYNDLRTLLLSEIGHVFGEAIIFSTTKSLAKHRYLSIKTKKPRNLQISLDRKNKFSLSIILFE